ncbi:hypothetical protein [Bythopirellula polymerisocia]|uniref:Uncharacterized protein n=1 Tax=Bythopirellula polymerisocia TaxID=2528003 RepID=A0A5C6CUW1_9BACT|nr:hypothetical protein [Bythopirellula polymerisocia]TWU27287.1 hypothetical protein Pla144_20590 [Bythopirellula polymerisocia]
MIKQCGLTVLLMLASLSVGKQAQAQYGIGGYGGYNFWDAGRLYSVLADNVPYYAAFPPVYYSVPVARTYGYSPFAYPPGTMTPEIEMCGAAAEEIVNPYVVPTSTSTSEEKPASDDRVTQTQKSVQPLLVVNPYIESQLARTASTSGPGL